MLTLALNGHCQGVEGCLLAAAKRTLCQQAIKAVYDPRLQLVSEEAGDQPVALTGHAVDEASDVAF